MRQRGNRRGTLEKPQPGWRWADGWGREAGREVNRGRGSQPLPPLPLSPYHTWTFPEQVPGLVWEGYLTCPPLRGVGGVASDGCDAVSEERSEAHRASLHEHISHALSHPSPALQRCMILNKSPNLLRPQFPHL